MGKDARFVGAQGTRGKTPRSVEGAVATPVTVSDARLDSLSGLELVGRYQLGELRAEGAFCVVYDAHDRELKRVVAVKVAALEQAAVYREALNVTAGLSYPAFLAIYDLIEQDARLFLVHEFVDGRPLSAYVSDGAPVRRGVALALQLARAVAYAHQHDLAHGDLTPAAILIDRGAVAHINNVGMPPDWDYFSAIASSLALSDVIHSADETLAALRDDARLRDVWSVAATLWLLITRVADEREVTGAAARRAFGADVSAEIQALLTRALDITHPQRVTTAEELALALEAQDEALTRAANPQRDTLPLAVGAYREARAAREARGVEMATGRRGRSERDARQFPEAATYSGVTDPMALDTSATRPADDGLYAAAGGLAQYSPYPQRAYPPYDPRRAARGERMRTFDGAPDANPAWPMESVAGETASHVMQPWTWALIGVVLFTAFFLIGFLVFPQF